MCSSSSSISRSSRTNRNIGRKQIRKEVKNTERANGQRIALYLWYSDISNKKLQQQQQPQQVLAAGAAAAEQAHLLPLGCSTATAAGSSSSSRINCYHGMLNEQQKQAAYTGTATKTIIYQVSTKEQQLQQLQQHQQQWMHEGQQVQLRQHCSISRCSRCITATAATEVHSNLKTTAADDVVKCKKFDTIIVLS